jgi:outer membrane protein OmpA-like peptidoglycan-associated protein
MSQLIDTIKSYLTPELIQSSAQLLNENESAVAKAAGGLVPTILAGLLNKSQDASSNNSLFSSISQFDDGVLGKLGNLLGSGNLAENDPKDFSGRIMSSIFGDKVPAIINAVASFSGVKQSSASSLLGLAGPLVFGVLGKKIKQDGLNLSSFSQLLSSEKSSLMQLLPAGIGSVLGMQGISNTGFGSQGTVKESSGSSNNWWLPILLLLGIGAGIVYFMKNCGSNKAVETSVAVKKDTIAAAPVVVAPEVYSNKLSTGFEIKGNIKGIESQLITFIADAAKPVDKTSWFNFDQLNFKTGSAELDMDYSKQQLLNIYEVLKAFPKVKIRIGGYTDSDGDEKANLALSQKRADNVMAALVALGVEKTRLSAEGYGEQYPECTANDTPECKAKNRRIAVRVTEK